MALRRHKAATAPPGPNPQPNGTGLTTGPAKGLQVTDDPDDRATADAAAVLKKLLSEDKHTMTANRARWIAFNVINEWVQKRTHHWAVRRGIAQFGTPDAMTVGFAEASLTQIADKASGLPFDQPIGKWSKNDVARLFAIAHEAIEATRIQTLEDPTTEAMPA